jgi:hypothetical protein
MKPKTVAITIAVLALPIYAQDQPRPNTTSTTLSAPISMEQVDSPLVRAAKATGRLGKKPGFVITNDTLLRVGSTHMSIATSQGAPLPPPAPTVRTAPAATPQQTAPKPKTDAEARRRQARQASSDFYGDDQEPRHVDPAVVEHQMQQAASPKPPHE